MYGVYSESGSIEAHLQHYTPRLKGVCSFPAVLPIATLRQLCGFFNARLYRAHFAKLNCTTRGSLHEAEGRLCGCCRI